jgi:hypothetical protein
MTTLLFRAEISHGKRKRMAISPAIDAEQLTQLPS